MAGISKAESTPTTTFGEVLEVSIDEKNNSSDKKTQDVFTKKSSLIPPGDWSKCGTPEQEYAFYEYCISQITNVHESGVGKKSTAEEERNFHIKLLMEEKGVSEESAAAEYDYYN